MFARLRRLFEWLSTPNGTAYTPATFGRDDIEFILAVLRACPIDSTLHLEQCEDESWVTRLRNWSERSSPEQFEADYYRIDDDFVDAVERLVAELPSSLACVPDVTIKSPDGRFLLAAVDNFSLITSLADEIREALGKADA